MLDYEVTISEFKSCGIADILSSKNYVIQVILVMTFQGSN